MPKLYTVTLSHAVTSSEGRRRGLCLPEQGVQAILKLHGHAFQGCQGLVSAGQEPECYRLIHAKASSGCQLHGHWLGMRWLHNTILTRKAEAIVDQIFTMKSRCCAIWPAAPETATVRVGFHACFRSS